MSFNSISSSEIETLITLLKASLLPTDKNNVKSDIPFNRYFSENFQKHVKPIKKNNFI